MQKEIIEKKLIEIEEYKKSINEYYDTYTIKEFKLLMLYQEKSIVRDIHTVCKACNIQSEIFTYQDSNSIEAEQAFLKCINEYKPTAILVGDITRKEFPFFLHENIIVITWQDWDISIRANINAYLEKLSEKDLIITPYLNSEALSVELTKENTIKHEKQVIRFPFTCRSDLYKLHTISLEEHKKYDTDICIIGSNNEFTIKRFFNTLYLKGIYESPDKQDLVKWVNDTFKEIRKLTQQKQMFIEDKEIYKVYSNKLFECYLSKRGIREEDVDWSYLDSVLCFQIACNIFRSSVVEWVIEGNYNLKLYGAGWELDDKTAPFAMSIVENGEELSKMYSCSKIVVGNHPILGLHRSTFEPILSGSIKLLPYPSKWDWSKANELFEVGEGIDYYRNKEELYSKIDYYLKHEDRREEVIQKGRDVIYKNKLYSEEVIKELLYKIIDRTSKLQIQGRKVRKNQEIGTTNNQYRIILFGTGTSMNRIVNIINKETICLVAYCDNDKEKQKLFMNGIEIIAPDQINRYSYDYIIICSEVSYQIMTEQLILLGVPKEKIIQIYNQVTFCPNSLFYNNKVVRNETSKLFSHLDILRRPRW